MEIIKPGTRFDFMGMRKFFYVLSSTLFLLSLFAIFVRPGPNWGTDFKGGTEVEVTLLKHASAADVRSAVESSGFATPDVVADQKTPNRFVIRVQEVSALSPTAKSQLATTLCASDDAKNDEARCPEALRAEEVRFSPAGDKITLRYKHQPDLTAIGKLVAGSDLIQLREPVIASWPKNRGEYEQKYKTIGVPTPKEGEPASDWPSSPEAFKAKFGFAPGAISTISTREGDVRVEIDLRSKGDQLLDGLQSKLGIEQDTANVQWIGGKNSTDLRNSAFKSIFIALFFIMAYVAFRFDMRFAPGAIVSLFHDVLIAIGAMCALQKEISLSTIAAVLTVLGYSITDTVVVYDRIRENLGKHRNMTFSEIVNLSVSEMFGRTILTSGTAALSMVCFLIFGTQVIKDFAFVFLIGVTVGTYSSIYVAAPLTEWIDRRFFAHKEVQRTKAPSRQRQQKQAESVV